MYSTLINTVHFFYTFNGTTVEQVILEATSSIKNRNSMESSRIIYNYYS